MVLFPRPEPWFDTSYFLICIQMRDPACLLHKISPASNPGSVIFINLCLASRACSWAQLQLSPHLVPSPLETRDLSKGKSDPDLHCITFSRVHGPQVAQRYFPGVPLVRSSPKLYSHLLKCDMNSSLQAFSLDFCSVGGGNRVFMQCSTIEPRPEQQPEIRVWLYFLA